MKSIKRKLFGIGLILAIGVLLSACGDKKADDKKSMQDKKVEEKKTEEKKPEAKKVEEKKTEEKEDMKKVSLSDWMGEWNNIEGYLDKPEVKTAIEDKAKEEGKKADELLNAFKERRKADFMGVKVDGETLYLYDKFPSEKGKQLEMLTYKYIESHKVKHGNSELEWNVFETKDKDDYKYLLMMPVHGEDEIVHFHMRYGKDKDQLLKDEKWYPTMVKPSSTMQQVITEITE